MEYANITFESVQLLLDMLEQIDNCSSTFANDNPPDGPLVEALQSYLNTPIFNTLSGANQSVLTRLESLLESGSPDNIWNRTEELHEYVTLIEKYVGLVDWDVFYPVDSEDHIINISFDKELQKDLGMSSVFAGKITV